MLKSVKVRDYMTTDLVTFSPEMDLFRAIDRLLAHRISGAPVLDADGHLVGLLSEGDCLKGIVYRENCIYYELSKSSLSKLLLR